MEHWNKANRMITQIGDNQDPYEYLDVCTERLRIIETNLSTHIKWFTHKNPYGCSICDVLNLLEKVLYSFESFLGPRMQETGGTAPLNVTSQVEGKEEINS